MHKLKFINLVSYPLVLNYVSRANKRVLKKRFPSASLVPHLGHQWTSGWDLWTGLSVTFIKPANIELKVWLFIQNTSITQNHTKKQSCSTLDKMSSFSTPNVPNIFKFYVEQNLDIFQTILNWWCHLKISKKYLFKRWAFFNKLKKNGRMGPLNQWFVGPISYWFKDPLSNIFYSLSTQILRSTAFQIFDA